MFCLGESTDYAQQLDEAVSYAVLLDRAVGWALRLPRVTVWAPWPGRASGHVSQLDKAAGLLSA